MDKHSKYVKRWADEHKDKVREANRKYMKKRYNNDPVYREKKKAYGRAWYKAHPPTEEQKKNRRERQRARRRRIKAAKILEKLTTC
jgi:hypothetical protein